jgi:RHS repeat-associated protein
LSQLDYNTANHMTTAPPDTFGYAGTDQVELTKAGLVSLNYGLEDQYGMPWLQSWTNGTNSTAYVERDGMGAPLGLRIDSTDYAYVLDGLGSPVAVVGSDNGVKATYKYDPYGTILAGSNENAMPQSNIIRYTGGIYHTNTKMTKLGQRWYNPNQGRFTQQDNLSFIGDPARGNRYAYAGDNPVNFIDPTGQSALGDYVGHVDGFLGMGTVIGGGIGLFATPIGATAGGIAGGLIGAGIGTIDYGLNEYGED